MKVLLDENLDPRFGELLVGCEVESVKSKKWRGLSNGELLRQAEVEFEAFVTLDRGIAHQQNVSGLKLRIVVILAPNNRLETIAPKANAVLAALQVTSSVNAIEV
jgi:predicted nuclease of predicted toxin-antitoxin system